MATINLDDAYEEFALLKQRNQARNNEYYLSRQAVQGNFRWPRKWPDYIDKVSHNLCKPITERFATYLLGKGFSYNVDRPNTLEFRDRAERTEKILRRLLDLSASELQFDAGAKSGAQLGRTVFKVYPKGGEGNKHACFTYCQPDYFYGVPAGDNGLSEYSVVYYSYPLDRKEAVRLFGEKPYKTETTLETSKFYNLLPEDTTDQFRGSNRRVPVMEVWTPEAYALVVGGVTIYNGDSPFKDKVTDEGYIPFVVIENIRNAGKQYGESDIFQARELNEQLNYLLSRKNHIVGRWLQPTLVWEGAPQNYADTLLSTIGGGGAIPARLGSRLYFLAYDRPNPAVAEQEATLRAAILDTCGMSELALQGTTTGSVNTGPALAAQYAPVLTTIEKKRKEWERGLKRLFRMLLDTQERIGDSDALGLAVINATTQSQQNPSGELVPLSGNDIAGLREVTIIWPEVLPKDDLEQARFEMEKLSQGAQSFYSTLEKLGEEYPDDEIARIRMENADPMLRGQTVAEQTRANATAANVGLKAQQQQFDQQQAVAGQQPGGATADQGGPPPSQDQNAPGQLPPGLSDKLRELARKRAVTQSTDASGNPVIDHGQA